MVSPRNVAISPREKQVLDLIKDGHSNHNIARMLEITTHTVKHHVDRLFEKTGTNSRHQLAMKYLAPLSSETRIRELSIERAELAGRLATVNEQLALLGGALDEEDKPPVLDFGFDFAARAGIASILADMAQGRD